jgi:hypothetical protein
MKRKPITVTVHGEPDASALDLLAEHLYGRLTAAPSLFLSSTELFNLTGYKSARSQIKWLRSRRWIFEINAAGAPRVARAHFERRMVGEATTPEPSLPTRHNFQALEPGWRKRKKPGQSG